MRTDTNRCGDVLSVWAILDEILCIMEDRIEG